MSKKISSLRGLALATLMVSASLSHAAPVSFTFTDAAQGNLTATFTLDVVGGIAQSGTGSITSTLLPGTDTLTLLTASSTPAVGSINPTGPGSNFTWHGVASSGGADFIGDAVVNANAPYFSTGGLIFAISSGGSLVGGINIWANSNNSNTTYTGALAANGQCYPSCYGGSNGTLTPSSVPVPATAWLLGSGLMGLAATTRRKSKIA